MESIPSDVTEWFRLVFRDCNERITQKLSNNPNLLEESLDLTWIEHLSEFASPVTLGSGWTIKIDTHYLGGLRHFGSWEVADIGLLVFFRRGRIVEKSKVALLQSKRLYPTNQTVQVDDEIDYRIGFARLADPEMLGQSTAFEVDYEFNKSCRYSALSANSNQVKVITKYQLQNRLSIYYQFYNPWRIPFNQRIPLREFKRPAGELEVGIRIIPATLIHEVLSRYEDGRSPNLGAMEKLTQDNPYGWPLEHFIADLLLKCREGDVFTNISDERIQGLFYRRSGPIAAAISISIEAPER